MGGRISNWIATCILLILWPVCFKCRKSPFYGTAFDKFAKVDKSTIHGVWSNLLTVYYASDMCAHLEGEYLDSGKCALDFSEQDMGLVNHVDGLNSKSDLCGVLQGDYKGTPCIVNLEGAGTAPVLEKQRACVELKGEWNGDECVVSVLD